MESSESEMKPKPVDLEKFAEEIKRVYTQKLKIEMAKPVKRKVVQCSTEQRRTVMNTVHYL